MHFASFLVTAATALSLVNAHGLITEVAGANGITGQGFGVDQSTPRDGSSPVPFEQDTTKFAKGQRQLAASPCGSTKLGGENDVTTQLAAATAAGLPTAAADGTVSMTIHQVNQDGAGEYSCQVDPTGTGSSFEDMTVTQNVPGRDVPIIGSLSGAKATDFPVQAQLPAGTTCAGAGGACLMRCMNTAIAGPFGSCAAVAQAGSAATAANATRMRTRDGQQEALAIAKRWVQEQVELQKRMAPFLF